MTTKAKTTPVSIYQLKITLQGSKPSIWRRVQVANPIKLSKLHAIIQEVMGWENAHLHQFIINKNFYGVTFNDDFGGIKTLDENKYYLDQLITAPKSKFSYEYDFGDSWEHVILLEKILEPENDTVYPICIKGERACPPEDCGGIWGYEDMLETLGSESDEKEEIMEWLGADFDPEAFDIDQVNWRLKKHK
jgi:Plasmid pRiA4b ORF-3-like protein